jgi:hypothetical protein
MDFITNIKIEEHKLVHSSRSKTVYELADHLGKSHNYLCRMSSLTEDIPFPVELAVPAMKFMKNFDLLKMLNWECGFAMIKLPGKAKTKKDENEMTAEFTDACATAMKALVTFLNETTEENYLAFDKAIQNAVQVSLAVQQYCKKKSSGQFNLEF